MSWNNINKELPPVDINVLVFVPEVNKKENLMKKDKLAKEMHNITTIIKQKEEKEKKEKKKKKEIEINKRVQSLSEQRIEDISAKIKKAAKNGDSHILISALWSDAIEIKLQHVIQKWAMEQGFEIDTSLSEIYEPPHCSDDLPSDTRCFLTIDWE